VTKVLRHFAVKLDVSKSIHVEVRWVLRKLRPKAHLSFRNYGN